MKRNTKEKKPIKAILFAILAAALYAISTPVSKLILEEIPPKLMASFLYLGAGFGMFVIGILRSKNNFNNHIFYSELRLTRQELPYIIGMVVLDIAAPILLMVGLTLTTSSNVSLLNNFEIVATSFLAFFIFKETISKRLWLAIILITLSSMILSYEDISSLSFSYGSIFVLLACVCWGFENNCTRMLSTKNPLEVVVIKGFGSGFGSLIIALALGDRTDNLIFLIIAFILGFFSYGLSIFFYIYAQRDLGAAKTSAYYAISPFIGVGLSLVIYNQIPTVSFIVACIIMMLGTYFASV